MASKDEKILRKMEKKHAKYVKKQQRGPVRKFLGRMFLGMFIAILLVILVCVIRYGGTLIKYHNDAVRMVKEGGVEAFKSGETSILYADDGTEINTLSGEKDMYYLNIDEIPYLVKRALISTEDRSFYDHSGVDYYAVVRASVELIKNKGEVTQGGSTITQQLCKLVFLSSEVSFQRKIKEMFTAMEVEKTYSKDQILEFYINNIYFANGYYGIQAAAQGYFSKNATELSLSEIAFLCSIPNNPTKYDPFTNFQNTMKRRDRILKEMLEQGDIDKSMYDEAVAATIVLFPSQSSINNYVETYAKYCATVQLMKQQGFEFKYDFPDETTKNQYEEQYDTLYDECSQKLYTGGYRIYTSIDLNKQALLQSNIDLRLGDYTDVSDEGIFKLQGAATCIDNTTGYVVAIVGGRSQDSYGYTLNRAFQSYRQPGSTMKPIAVYTPAFEGEYSPSTYVKDAPIEDGPVNSPNSYDGWMTIRKAVEKSKNTVAWNLFEEMTPEVGLSYLKKMGFKKICSDDYVAAAAIGGLTYGVTTEEMASAYAAIEHDGIFRMPTCIKRITDSSGNVIVENTNPETQIYETNAARQMTDTLKGVLVRGTGTKFQVDDAICAAKTGTTNGDKDIWLCGYSAYYTTSVWVGYDLPEEINDSYVVQSPGKIWQEFMTTIHENLDEVEFPEPDEGGSHKKYGDDYDDSGDSDDSDSGEDNNSENVEESSSEENPEETQETSEEQVNPDEEESSDRKQEDEENNKNKDNKKETEEKKETEKKDEPVETEKPKETEKKDDTGGEDQPPADEGGEIYQESWE